MSSAKSLLWALPGGQVSKDAGVFGHEVFGSTVVFGVHALHFQKDVFSVASERHLFWFGTPPRRVWALLATLLGCIWQVLGHTFRRLGQAVIF